jgi:putative tricarboxylic transport membrane protein
MTGQSPERQRRPQGAAYAIAAGLAAFGGLLVREGWRIPDRGGYSGVGPGDVPVIVGSGLLVLACWTAIDAWRGRGTELPKQELAPVLWIGLGLVLQLLLLKPLGFTLATALLFACAARAFGKTNLALTLGVGLVLSFVVFGVFDKLLTLNLPTGWPEKLVFGG